MKVVSVLCLFVVALAYTAAQQQFPPAPADGSCEPGKTYQKDCNTCTCGPNGRLAACTLAACLSKRSAEPQECSAGETKQEDCNTCTCANGKWACTKKGCIRKRAAQAQFPPAPADGSCEPGRTYQKDCNTCVCAPNGRLGACTLAACLSKRSAEPQECSAGQTKQEDCNTCTCANGLWACTRKACLRKRAADDLPPLPTGPCEPGKSYKQDCNTCICGPDGKPGCTYKLCLPSRSKRYSEPQECSAGQTKQEDCNTCTCANGRWGCTRRACLKKRDTPLPPLPPDGKCVSGNSYQQDCNTCRCLPDGKLACTDKLCVTKRSAAADECAIGDTKKENCNDCKCTQLGDGRTGWVCTRRACPPNFPDRSKRAAEVCTEGDTKEEQCNNCRCLKLGDGSTDWACTKRVCPSDPERSRRDV